MDYSLPGSEDAVMRNKTLNKWFGIEILGEDGKWKDAGEFYEAPTKRDCRREMVECNFWGHKVRMVEYRFCRVGPVGNVKNFKL